MEREILLTLLRKYFDYNEDADVDVFDDAITIAHVTTRIALGNKIPANTRFIVIRFEPTENGIVVEGEILVEDFHNAGLVISDFPNMKLQLDDDTDKIPYFTINLSQYLNLELTFTPK